MTMKKRIFHIVEAAAHLAVVIAIIAAVAR